VCDALLYLCATAFLLSRGREPDSDKDNGPAYHSGAGEVSPSLSSSLPLSLSLSLSLSLTLPRALSLYLPPFHETGLYCNAATGLFACRARSVRGGSVPVGVFETLFWLTAETLQGYLAHKKPRPP